MHSKTAAQLLLGLAIAIPLACGSLPRRGNDDVVVMIGDASVYERERFMSDRYDDLQWLRSQLDEKRVKEYEQGIQGASSTVSRSEIGFAARAVFDAVNGTTLAQDIDKTPPEEPSGGGSEGDEEDPSTSQAEGDERGDSPTNVDLASLQDLLDTASSPLGQELLKRIAESAPRPSPRDILRDRLAFRDEVRSAVRQRALDDTHDLEGSSLYELQFDLSMAAGRNAGSAYAVAITVVEDSAPPYVNLTNQELRKVAEQLRNEATLRAFLFGERIRTNTVTAKDVNLLANAALRGRYCVQAEFMTRLHASLKHGLKTYEEAADLLAGGLTESLNLVIEMTEDRGDRDSARRILGRGSKRMGIYKDATSVFNSLDISRIRPRVLFDTLLCPDAPIELVVTDLSAALARIEDGRFTVIRFQKALLQVKKDLDTAKGLILRNAEKLENSAAILQSCVTCENEILASFAPDSLQFLSFTASSGGIPVGPVDDSSPTLVDSSNDQPSLVSAIGLPIPAVTIPTPEANGPADAGQKPPLIQLLDSALNPTWGNIRSYAKRFGAILAANQIVEEFPALLTLDVRVGLGADVDLEGLDLVGVREPIPSNARNAFSSLSRKTRVIGISPEVQAERLSTTAQSDIRRAFKLAISGQATPNTALGAEFQNLRQELRRYDLIARNPLVVGFINAPGYSPLASDVANTGKEPAQTFGWILSPRLETTTAGDTTLRYRQLSDHYPVSVRMIVPAGCKSLQFQMRILEIRSDGDWCLHEPQLIERGLSVPLVTKGDSFEVKFPIDVESIVRGAMFAKDPHSADPFVVPAIWNMQVGQRASLVIQGGNVWRSPEVYVGGQRADRVRILPDLNGVSVEFDKVDPLAGAYTAVEKVDLVVSTSQGTDVLRRSVNVFPKSNFTASRAKLEARLEQKAAVGEIVAASKVVPKEISLDLVFILSKPLSKSVSGMRLGARRDGVLGPLFESDLDSTRIRVSKDRKKVTVLGVALPTRPYPEILVFDLWLRTSVDAEWEKLTNPAQGLLVVRPEVTLDRSLPNQVTVPVAFDGSPNALHTSAATPLEFHASNFPVASLKLLFPDTQELQGHSMRLFIGGNDHVKVQVTIKGKPGKERLYCVVPKNMALPNVATTNGVPKSPSQSIKLVDDEVTLVLGTVTLN